VANRIVAGLVAGAAGTIALNITTYLDMLIRGRPASTLPAQVAAKLADEIGLPLDFDDDDGNVDADDDDATEQGPRERQPNREAALGALLGLSNGLGIGLAYGLVRIVLPRPPAWMSGAALGGLAMAASDYPATQLGLTDPRDWSGSDWAADVVPHMAYGVTTAVVFEALKK
jgi:hypothetical protein